MAMLMSEAVSRYLDFLKFRRNRSSDTISTYRSILRVFVDFVGDKPMSSLVFFDVDAYATRIAMDGHKIVTTKNKLTAIRGFLKWARVYEICQIAPEKIELPKMEPDEANFLTEEEQVKFLSVITSPRDLAMMKVFLSSGVRTTELLNLRLHDIYNRSVVVRHGKGNKNRVTFITKDTESAIDFYISTVRGDEEGYLFPNPDGNRLSRVTPDKKVRFYAEKAGIHKKVVPRTLRHSFATTMLMRGARIEDVQKLLGHTNIQTTLIYLHFLNPYLGEIYGKIMEPTEIEAIPA